MGLINTDLEDSLSQLPDKVADALQKWRIATLEREKCEALLYMGFKGGQVDRTATEIKALINGSGERYSCVLDEIKAESEYVRLNEKLMAIKKEMSMRTAF